MTRDARVTCLVCAWRADCQKRFRNTDALHCHDFTRDVTIKEPPADAEVEENQNHKETDADERPA